MAFVYKSKKEINLINNQNTIVGPGSYYSEESSKNKNLLIQNVAPFRINEKKELSLSTNIKNQCPGPGSYNLTKEIKKPCNKKEEVEPPIYYKISVNKNNESNKFFNGNIEKNIKDKMHCDSVTFEKLNNNFKNEHKLLEFDQITNKITYQIDNKESKAPFNVTTERFPDSKINNPGPGYYELLNTKYEKDNKLKRSRTARSIKYKRKASPPKISEFNITTNQFNIKDRIVEEKSDYYDFLKMDKHYWETRKGGDLWSKSKIVKKCRENDKIEAFDPYYISCKDMNKTVSSNFLRNKKLVNGNDEQSKYSTAYNSKGFNKTGINFKKMKETSMSFNQMKELRKTFYKDNNIETNTKQAFKEEVKYYLDKLEKVLPGPGYYHPNIEDLSGFRVKPSVPENQNFGSSSTRFKIHTNNYDTSRLGPGYYFENNNKRSKSSTIRPIKIENKVAIREIPNKTDNDVVPGPGQYNLEKNIIKKSNINTKSIFGSGQVRFPIFDKKNDSLVDTTVNTLAPEKHDKNLFRKIVKRHIPATSQYAFGNTLDKKEKVILDNRFYDIQQNSVSSRLNKLQSTRVGKQPFNSSEKRFSEFKYDSIGPGSYLRERKHLPDEKSSFNTTEKKFFNINKQIEIGPGQYTKNSYFDWNKKSFNVNFI